MSKTITITVINTEEGTETTTLVVPHTEQNPNAIPNEEEWDKLLEFQDKHIGGRPIGR